ncbi:MAG: hypothetical protein Ta2E_09630 [Mycoplasmoidaceae bacterium]|nr:MAG: hypothetical protein Ta2E_09630 [Mycoplasmoidaceae bacterium]
MFRPSLSAKSQEQIICYIDSLRRSQEYFIQRNDCRIERGWMTWFLRIWWIWIKILQAKKRREKHIKEMKSIGRKSEKLKEKNGSKENLEDKKSGKKPLHLHGRAESDFIRKHNISSRKNSVLNAAVRRFNRKE